MDAVKDDLKTDQLVTDPDLKDADVVNQSDLVTDPVNQTQQDGTLADGTSKAKSVPYEELEKAVKAKNDAQEQTAYAQRRLELMEQNSQQTTQQVPKSTYEQAMDQCGLTADDLYGENIIRVQSAKDQLDAQKMQQVQSLVSTQQFAVSHPDLEQVVGSVNPTTGLIAIASAEVTSLSAKMPYLVNASTPEIYEAVMQERELQKLKASQTSATEHQKRQNVDNAIQPLGGSAAGGGGGEVQGSGMMSREQQLDIERRLDNGEEIT